MTEEELESLLTDLESDRVELKESISDKAKIAQAICAFANDLPNHQKPGIVFIGVRDDGSCANLVITETLLNTLGAIRSDGNILPPPALTVQKRVLRRCEMAVVVVQPSRFPPVRYNGRVWIRVGARRAQATLDEERQLTEKRRFHDLPFDLYPIETASVNDLDIGLFEREYLTSAVAHEILERNDRTTEQQMASLRLAGPTPPHCPTITGMLVLGKSPANWVPGAYVQFLRIEGTELTDPIIDQHELHGPLQDVIRRLDDLMKANIRTATDISSNDTEVRRPDYPLSSLQQLVRNALMHRNYQTSNAPVRLTWFTDSIEILSPGGPYGQVTRENFGDRGITDYRNPHLSEAMRILGYVQRFGVGIMIAQKALFDNGNPEAEFRVEPNHILVTVRSK